MKSLALAASLVVSPLLVVGAPASFTVTGTAVECTVRGDAAEVRVSWDLRIAEAACGWVSAETSGLPAASTDREVVLLVDGKRVPARFEEEGNRWLLGMDRHGDRIGPELEKAKSVRLVATFRGVPVEDGALAIPLEGIRPLWRKAKENPAPPLKVRVVRGSGEEAAALEASFAKAAPGSRLEIAAGTRALGVRLIAPEREGTVAAAER